MNQSKSSKIQIFCIVILSAVAIFFSLYQLTESPSFWYDEGWYFQDSANLLSVGIDGLQMAPDDVRHISITTVGYPLIYTMALWMKFFGISVLSARSLMVIFLLGLLAVSFFLARRMFGTTMAIASFALLATFPPLYGNGKSMLGEVPGLFFLALSLLTLHLSSLGHSRRLYIILSGLFLGLCLATKPIFLLFLPAFVIGIVIQYWRKEITSYDIGLGLIFTLLPIVAWFFAQFGSADTISNIFGYYANPYYKTDLLATIIGNAKGMLRDMSTLYTLFIMLVWTVALWIRKVQKERIGAAEVVAFIFSALIVLAFLRTEGWYRYLFPAQIVALIFLPYSLEKIFTFGFSKLNLGHAPRISLAFIALLTILGIYQLGWRSWVADAYGSQKTAFWEEYFSKVPDTTTVFFNNTPEVVPFVQHRNYYQYISCAAGEFGKEQLQEIPKGTPDLIVMRHEAYTKEDPMFKLYELSTTTYKYSILVKKN